MEGGLRGQKRQALRRANEQSSRRMEDGKRAAVWAVIKVRDSGGPLLSDSRTHSNLSERQKEREAGVEGRDRDRQTDRGGNYWCVCVTELIETVDFPH